MGVTFGMEEGTFGATYRIGATYRPYGGEKPQNRPLSKLNTGRFALRAMLPVINDNFTARIQNICHQHTHMTSNGHASWLTIIDSVNVFHSARGNRSAATYLLFNTACFLNLFQQFDQTSSFPPLLWKFLHKLPCTMYCSILFPIDF